MWNGLDGANNWATVDEGPSTPRRTNTFDATNSLDSSVKSGVTTTYDYDANGNLVEDDKYEYTYDGLNRLRKVHNKATNQDVATYEYDALGRRVSKTTSSGSTQFYYDGVNAIEERDGTTVLRQFVFGDKPDEVLVMDRYQPTVARFHYLRDALGSVIGLTDSTGTLKEGYLYDAYGKTAVVRPGTNGVVDWGNDDTTATSSELGNPHAYTPAANHRRRCRW